jgi:hypothetical protein
MEAPHFSERSLHPIMELISDLPERAGPCADAHIGPQERNAAQFWLRKW